MKNVSPFVEIFPLNYFFTTWQLSHMKGMRVCFGAQIVTIYLVLRRAEEEGSRPIFYSAPRAKRGGPNKLKRVALTMGNFVFTGVT